LPGRDLNGAALEVTKVEITEYVDRALESLAERGDSRRFPSDGMRGQVGIDEFRERESVGADAGSRWSRSHLRASHLVPKPVRRCCAPPVSRQRIP
jgi:hypothetical protein